MDIQIRNTITITINMISIPDKTIEITNIERNRQIKFN
jgi:hypothetical protein